ncbi:MAG TPA: hypothetical protein VGY66_05345 [Gemmataceae bacterium]|jgi:ABC-type branched-subunit amino acid transport system ATPase component|nr:hypothetical protein [Gemmataceae bacterium]
MIEVVNVTQHYGIRPVLKGIDLRIERGELAAVVGPNGMANWQTHFAESRVKKPFKYGLC